SDLGFKKICNTLWLHTTTYFAWVVAINNLFTRYGYVSVKPVLCKNTPEWQVNVYLDVNAWREAFTSPKNFSKEEKMRFLARVIDGDGWISLCEKRSKRPAFTINITTIYNDKAALLEEVIMDVGLTPSKFKRFRYVEKEFDGHVLKSKHWEHILTIYRREDVEEFLKHIKMLHPFKEVKRLWALRILEDGIKKDEARILWQFIRNLEKLGKLYGQLKAIEQLTIKFERDSQKLQRLIDIREKLLKKFNTTQNTVEQLRMYTIKLPKPSSLFSPLKPNLLTSSSHD
ncbi:MAG: hypothetical protein ABDH32_04845, partial [Candidatus Caldarchaeales archaeon]